MADGGQQVSGVDDEYSARRLFPGLKLRHVNGARGETTEESRPLARSTHGDGDWKKRIEEARANLRSPTNTVQRRLSERDRDDASIAAEPSSGRQTREKGIYGPMRATSAPVVQVTSATNTQRLHPSRTKLAAPPASRVIRGISPSQRRRTAPAPSLRNGPPVQSAATSTAGLMPDGISPSPTSSPTPNAMSAVQQQRVERVLRARLYLLQRSGPNSFVVGGDSPEHKYRVIIGPQTCNCGKGAGCNHVLFVMLRVLKIDQNNPLLWSKKLLNYEAEALLDKFDERVSKRVSEGGDRKRFSSVKKTSFSSKADSIDMSKAVQSAHSSLSEAVNTKGTTAIDNDTLSSTSSMADIGNDLESGSHDDEEVCPICLLEMLDGESMVECTEGCHNQLHHHCLAIWAEERTRAGDALYCPLCRTKWPDSVMLGSTPRNSGSQLALTTPRISPGDDVSDMIPEDRLDSTAPWVQVYGLDVISSLFSRSWSVREMALQRMQRVVMTKLLTSRDGTLATDSRRLSSEWSSWSSDDPRNSGIKAVLHSTMDVIRMCVADPVLKVYESALDLLQTLLAYLPAHSSEQLDEVQRLLKPILGIILTKCAEPNRRTSTCSLSMLEKICHGQQGGLLVGSALGANAAYLGGLDYLLSVAVDTSDQPGHTLSAWQWWRGRLRHITEVMEKFVTHFVLKPSESSAQTVRAVVMKLCPHFAAAALGNSQQFFEGDNETDMVEQAPFRRLLQLMLFSAEAMYVQHLQVSKLSRRCFFRSAQAALMWPTSAGIVRVLVERLRPVHRSTLAEWLKLHSFGEHEGMPVGYSHGNEQVHRSDQSVPGKQQSPVVAVAETKSCIRVVPQGMVEPLCPAPMPTPPATPCGSLDLSASLAALLTPPRPVKVHEVPQFACTAGLSTLSSVRESEKLSSSSSRSSHQFLCSGASTDSCESQKSPSVKEPQCDSLTADPTALPTNRHDSGIDSPQQSVTDEPCQTCAEAVEEEAKATLAAQEASLYETPLPPLDGLAPPDELVNVHHQPTGNEMPDAGTNVYMEGVQWRRGQVLGTGAFSSCYLARDIKVGTLMCVKQVSFMRNTAAEQEKVRLAIEEEVAMLARLDHPHIVRCLGATCQDGHYNIFVEWMPGGSVASLLDRYGAFDPAVVVNYLRQMLRGLAYLHENRTIHRDIKGANILVDSTGQHVRLSDFGASARLATQVTGAGEFQGQLLGTVAFMAPEVLRGEHYGRACDIWSIGCCVIEMMTAAPPWGAKDVSNHLALIYKIASASGPPQVPESFPPGLRDICLRCLEMAAADRPAAPDLLLHPILAVT